MKPYSCEPPRIFRRTRTLHPAKHETLCFKRRWVSFFQKIPGTKIILQFLGKKTQECLPLCRAVVTLQTSATMRSFFTETLLYRNPQEKGQPFFFSGHQQNASVCQNLRFERGHVGILFLSFHPQTDGFWDPLATIFAKGPFILEVHGGPTGILGLTV